MTPAVKQTKIDRCTIGKNKYSLAVFKDALGKCFNLFTIEEPGKEVDEITLSDEQIKAFKALIKAQ